MKNIVVFTGAGISKESGIKTFRDGDDSYWSKYKIEDVATKEGWKKDKELVLDFYNKMHLDMGNYEPNDAHKKLARLDKDYNVTVITQNVDDLHEKAGSKNVLHLHGELNKKRSTNKGKIYDWDKNETINLTDKAEDGSRYRPHIVWFGEYPYNIQESVDKLKTADYLIIIGTSLQIGYVTPLLGGVNKNTKTFFLNPEKVTYLDSFLKDIEYIEKTAIDGIDEIIEKLK